MTREIFLEEKNCIFRVNLKLKHGGNFWSTLSGVFGFQSDDDQHLVTRWRSGATPLFKQTNQRVAISIVPTRHVI